MPRNLEPRFSLRRLGGWSWAVALVPLAAVSTACGGDDGEVVVRASDIGHVHDLVGDGDTLLVATHRGLLRVEASTYRLVGEQIHDLMSMAELDGGTLVASGHPDLRLEEYRVDGAPPFLGLITSTDGGDSWDAGGLLGRADFHAIDVEDGTMLGADSTGTVWRLSRNGGGQPIGSIPFDVNDLAISPDDPDVVVATSWDSELAMSEDAGQTWELLAEAPPIFEIEWATTGLIGAADSGELWTAPGPTGPFERSGNAPVGVETLLVHEDGVWIANDGGQLHRQDEDGSWSPLIRADD